MHRVHLVVVSIQFCSRYAGNESVSFSYTRIMITTSNPRLVSSYLTPFLDFVRSVLTHKGKKTLKVSMASKLSYESILQLNQGWEAIILDEPTITNLIL